MLARARLMFAFAKRWGAVSKRLLRQMYLSSRLDGYVTKTQV